MPEKKPNSKQDELLERLRAKSPIKPKEKKDTRKIARLPVSGTLGLIKKVPRSKYANIFEIIKKRGIKLEGLTKKKRDELLLRWAFNPVNGKIEESQRKAFEAFKKRELQNDVVSFYEPINIFPHSPSEYLKAKRAEGLKPSEIKLEKHLWDMPREDFVEWLASKRILEEVTRQTLENHVKKLKVVLEATTPGIEIPEEMIKSVSYKISNAAAEAHHNRTQGNVPKTGEYEYRFGLEDVSLIYLESYSNAKERRIILAWDGSDGERIIHTYNIDESLMTMINKISSFHNQMRRIASSIRKRAEFI